MKMRKPIAKSARRQQILCVKNDGYLSSLEKWKIYDTLPDTQADGYGLARIIDESGDDYLYPKNLFHAIALPQAVKKGRPEGGAT
jgi:hypothetical protein